MDLIPKEDTIPEKWEGLGYHNHISRGYLYLLSLGYKDVDIIVNPYRDGNADLKTIIDNKDWEVKVVTYSPKEGGDIIFTYDQIKYMRRDSNVIIFSKLKEPEVIKFEDILSGKYNK